MAQIDREWGEVHREAYDAVDDATRLNPGAFGDLVALLRERLPLRNEGKVKLDIPPGTKDGRGNPVNWSAPPGDLYTADRCPFCNEERTFFVYDGGHYWQCSECRRMGGAVEWVMVMENVSGAEAVLQLKVRGWLKAGS